LSITVAYDVNSMRISICGS